MNALSMEVQDAFPHCTMAERLAGLVSLSLNRVMLPSIVMS